MASAAADGVQESEEVSRARACIDDEVDEQLSALLVTMSHHVTVSSGDTLTSIPNSESAGTTESSSAATVSLGKHQRGLSDTSDSQGVPSVPKPHLTIKIHPSAARIASLQARNDDLHVSHIVQGSDSQHKDLQDEYCWCRGPESGEMVQYSFSSCNQWVSVSFKWSYLLWLILSVLVSL